MATRLHLRLDDLSRHEIIVTARIRIFYACDEDGQDLVRLAWQQVDADGDYRRTNALVDRLVGATVGGKPLASLLSAHGVGLLQFAPSYVWPSLFVTTQLAELLEPLFSQARPTVVVLHGAGGPYGHIWEALTATFAVKAGARLERRSLARRWAFATIGEKLKLRLRGWGCAYLVRHWRRRATAYRKTPIGVESVGEAEGNGTILFVTLGDRHWKQVRGGDGMDEQCYPIALALANSGYHDLRFIDAQGVDDVRLGQRNGKLGGARVQWKRFGGFSGVMVGYFLSNWLRLDCLRRKTMNDYEFNQSLTYRGVSLVPALTETFRMLFLDIAFEAQEFMVAAARVIREESPAAIVLTYETGPAQRAMIIEAQRAGIPTVGLQHGMIFDNHYDYMHDRVTTTPLEVPGAIAIPNVTCVWGGLWRDTLVNQGHYPANALEVTGNWRYDDIERTRDAATQPLASIDGIAGFRRVIAILTAGADIETYVRSCLALVTGLGDFTPVVKLHPSENPKGIEAVIAAAGLPAATLYTGDLAALLVRSEVVISQFSTAVTEALLLDRPVVLVNLTHLKFTSAYQASDACLYAESAAELETCVRQLIGEPAVAARVAECRRRFVGQTCFHLDGGAAARVARRVIAAAGRVQIAGL